MPPHGHDHGHSHAGHGHSHGHATKPTDLQIIVINFDDLQADSRARPLLIASLACTLLTIFMVYSVTISKSLALTACTWLSIFSLFSLIAALISLGARKTASRGKDHDFRHTYGMSRVPVLAVFSSTVLAQLAAVFLIKESVEHLLTNGADDDAHGHVIGEAQHAIYFPAILVSVLSQLIAAYAVNNEPMRHVLTAAQSSWLQEHAADISRTLCKFVPGLSRFLLPRLNSLGLLAVCSSVVCILAAYMGDYGAADSTATLIVSVCVMGTMLPLSSHTGRILLQTVPAHMLTQLDRAVRECNTLDGVLELTNCQFWQLDFQRICGTCVVRVRRDADEQQVLAHVTERLSAAVSILTVHVQKSQDISSRIGASSWGSNLDTYNRMAVPTMPSHYNSHGHSHDKLNKHGHSHDNNQRHSHNH